MRPSPKRRAWENGNRARSKTCRQKKSIADTDNNAKCDYAARYATSEEMLDTQVPMACLVLHHDGG